VSSLDFAIATYTIKAHFMLPPARFAGHRPRLPRRLAPSGAYVRYMVLPFPGSSRFTTFDLHRAFRSCTVSFCDFDNWLEEKGK
jgi:hypothetical protein